MSRQNVLYAALGGLALAAAPLTVASARSGDALAHAERACIDYGITPNSAGFDLCVDHVSYYFDRGAPTAAYREAAAVRDANNVCLSYRLPPQSLGFRGCVDNEIDRSAPVAAYTSDYPPPAAGPHVAATVDGYGNAYDRYGNLLDRYGYVIRYAH